MLELAVSGVLVLLRDTVGDTIVHLSDVVHKACPLSFWIISFMDIIHHPKIADNGRARGENRICSIPSA